jgi:hypothetical protein
MTKTAKPSVLDEATAEFIRRGSSMTVAARDDQHVPVSARAYGCRISADRQTVTVFVARRQAERLLSHVDSNRNIAAVFSRPTTHQAVQLKGTDARVCALEPGDGQIVAEWVGSFVVELGQLGFTAPFVHAAFAARPDEMSAIVFTPSDAFVQTPGPGAGARLRGAEPAKP